MIKNKGLHSRPLKTQKRILWDSLGEQVKYRRQAARGSNQWAGTDMDSEIRVRVASGDIVAGRENR
jgi:hypothetical protein